jgi:hypothetical protein
LVGVIGTVGESDQSQCLERAIPLHFRRDGRAAVEHGKFDVLQGGSAGEQVEALEDKSQFAISQVGQFVPAQRRNVDAIEQ